MKAGLQGQQEGRHRGRRRLRTCKCETSEADRGFELHASPIRNGHRTHELSGRREPTVWLPPVQGMPTARMRSVPLPNG